MGMQNVSILWWSRIAMALSILLVNLNGDFIDPLDRFLYTSGGIGVWCMLSLNFVAYACLGVYHIVVSSHSKELLLKIVFGWVGLTTILAQISLFVFLLR